MHRVVFSAFVFLDLFSSLIVQSHQADCSVGVFTFMGMSPLLQVIAQLLMKFLLRYIRS